MSIAEQNSVNNFNSKLYSLAKDYIEINDKIDYCTQEKERLIREIDSKTKILQNKREELKKSVSDINKKRVFVLNDKVLIVEKHNNITIIEILKATK